MRVHRGLETLGRAVLLLILPTLFLGLAELVARWLHEPEPLRRVYDPYAYRIPQPNLVDTFEGVDGEIVTVRMNELGMRGPRLSEPVLEGTPTVVFLGGSTTENYPFPLDATFPEIVGRRLSQSLDRPVRVFNAGMSSGTTSTSLARLQHQVLDLRPAVVVVLHGINDLMMGFRPDFRPDGRHLSPPAPMGRKPRSYLVDWLRHRRPRWSKQPRPADLAPAVLDYADFPTRRVFERNLRSMAAIASAHGVEMLLVTQKSMYSETPDAADLGRFRGWIVFSEDGHIPDVPSLARGMEAMRATVLRVAEETGAHVLDLAGRMPAGWDLFVDEVHFTRSGNVRVADELTPEIERILRESTSPGSSL